MYEGCPKSNAQHTLARVVDKAELYRLCTLDCHLVAVLPNNIFVIISKTMGFYEKCQRTFILCLL